MPRESGGIQYAVLPVFVTIDTDYWTAAFADDDSRDWGNRP